MRRNGGFTILEVLVVFIVLSVVMVVVMRVGEVFYDFFGRLRDEQKMEALRKKIERFYRENVVYVNSRVDAIKFSNGCEFTTFLGYKPRAKVKSVCDLGGLIYFDSEPYDYRGVNFRVLVTPLLYNGLFHYRDIYVINTRGRRGVSLSRFEGGRFICGVGEVCLKISGEDITREYYQKKMDELYKVADILQGYALSKYAQDTTKNILMYRFAKRSRDGVNNLNCQGWDLRCLYDGTSILENSCLVNDENERKVKAGEGRWLDVEGGVLEGAKRLYKVAPSLFSEKFYENVFIDNCLRVRNPETVSSTDLGGWTARLISCISNVDCYSVVVVQ